MKILDLIKKADELYPNHYSKQIKLDWCFELTSKISEEIRKIYSSKIFTKNDIYISNVTLENIESIFVDGIKYDKVDARSFKEMLPPNCKEIKIVYKILPLPYRDISLEGSFLFTNNSITIPDNPFVVGDNLDVIINNITTNVDVLEVNENVIITRKNAFNISGTEYASIKLILQDISIVPTAYESIYIDYILSKVAFYNNDKDLRGYFGGGADTLFWRTFQKAIADARSDFKPEGLVAYWENEAKTYNDESSNILRKIECQLKELVNSKLSELHGDNWLIHGLPKAVYTRAKKEADDQNYDNISKGITETTTSIWDCVNLSECREIATYGKNWSGIFEPILVRPEERKIAGDKHKKTEWIEKLGAFKNKLIKPTYSISKDEYDFINSTYSWLNEMSY